MTEQPMFEIDPVSKRSLFKAMRTMDDNAKGALKDEVTGITRWVASDIKAAAGSAPRSRQAQVVADSVNPGKQKVPYVYVGGRRARTLRNGTPAGVLLYGSEFGSDKYRQFPWRSPKLGRGSAGYWIYPTLRKAQPRLTREWKAAIERLIINPWGRI